MCCRQQVGKNVIIHLKLTLPTKTKRVTDDQPGRKCVRVYFGLTEKQVEKLKHLAKKEQKSESAVLRDILDTYIFNMEDILLVEHKPFKKTSPKSLIKLSRTIYKEQDQKLRKLSEKTGRGVSEIVRKVLGKYL